MATAPSPLRFASSTITWSTTPDLANVVSELLWRDLGWLDVAHIALVGEDPLADWAKYEARTSCVHLKDWAMGKFVEISEGPLDINFAGFWGGR